MIIFSFVKREGRDQRLSTTLVEMNDLSIFIKIEWEINFYFSAVEINNNIIYFK